MLNGSIPIGLTGVTKLCLSSVSFRRSTGVYKSDSIGSTGERNTVLTCQSTGVSSNQPASSISISSVQPAFRWISAGVSGELNRRNQPAFKPYASDRPALKKNAEPTCHIYLSPAFSLSLFSLHAAARLDPLRTAAFPSRRHRSTSPPPAHRHSRHILHPRTQLCAARAAARPRCPRSTLCTAAALRQRRSAPPPPRSE